MFELPDTLDRPPPLATAGAVPEARDNAVGSPRRYLELLPDQSAPRRRLNDQRKHQISSPPRAWLPEPWLSTVESPTYGRHPDRIRRVQKVSLKCGFRQVLAQSRIFFQTSIVRFTSFADF